MFACPGCGGRLTFDIPSQKLLCQNCSTTYDPYSVTDQHRAEEHTEYEATVFTCPQCGGQILSTDQSAADFCSFCGASTVLESRL